MRIRIFCFWSALTGYGRVARDYVACLTRAGHDVEVVDWSSLATAGVVSAGLPTSPEPRYRPYDSLVRPWPLDLDDGRLALVHGQPRLLAGMVAEGRLRTKVTPLVAMTTWETQSLPLEYVAAIAAGGFAKIIVPSQWCKTTFDESLLGPVAVVPHTFDPEWWDPSVRGRPMTSHAGGWLHFYSLGAWSERKNHLATCAAYLSTFTPADKVTLSIYAAGADLQALQSLRARSGLAPGDQPTIELVDQPLSEAELLKIHANNDVFVSSSRGEAWGMPGFEAAIMGREIISPLVSGEEEYLADYAACEEVQCSDTPAFAGHGRLVVQGYNIVGEQVTLVPGMDCRQRWSEPSLASLSSKMQMGYERHQDGEGGYGLGGTPKDRSDLVFAFGYEAVAPQLVADLEECTR